MQQRTPKGRRPRRRPPNTIAPKSIRPLGERTIRSLAQNAARAFAYFDAAPAVEIGRDLPGFPYPSADSLRELIDRVALRCRGWILDFDTLRADPLRMNADALAKLLDLAVGYGFLSADRARELNELTTAATMEASLRADVPATIAGCAECGYALSDDDFAEANALGCGRHRLALVAGSFHFSAHATIGYLWSLPNGQWR